MIAFERILLFAGTLRLARFSAFLVLKMALKIRIYSKKCICSTDPLLYSIVVISICFKNILAIKLSIVKLTIYKLL